ncbi:MAG: hypothetical protein RL071_491 [Pseudomonadota bacterium]
MGCPCSGACSTRAEPCSCGFRCGFGARAPGLLALARPRAVERQLGVHAGGGPRPQAPRGKGPARPLASRAKGARAPQLRGDAPRSGAQRPPLETPGSARPAAAVGDEADAAKGWAAGGGDRANGLVHAMMPSIEGAIPIKRSQLEMDAAKGWAVVVLLRGGDRAGATARGRPRGSDRAGVGRAPPTGSLRARQAGQRAATGGSRSDRGALRRARRRAAAGLGRRGAHDLLQGAV